MPLDRASSCLRSRFPAPVGGRAWLLAASLLATIAAPARAAGPPSTISVELHVGVNQSFNHGQARELGLELELPPGRWGIYPAIGGVAAEDGSGHLYLCLARDFRFGERWGATAFTGAAAYAPGRSGVELGGTAMYRSGVALSARLSERLSSSVVLYHLSNAHLRKRNPGTESLTFGLRWSAR